MFQINSDTLARVNVEIVIKILFQRLHIRYDLAMQLQQLGMKIVVCLFSYAQTI